MEVQNPLSAIAEVRRAFKDHDVLMREAERLSGVWGYLQNLDTVKRMQSEGLLDKEGAANFRRDFTRAFLILNAPQYDAQVVGVRLADGTQVLKEGVIQTEGDERIVDEKDLKDAVQSFMDKTKTSSE